MRERGRLSDQIDGVKRLERDVADALGLIELAEAEGDADTANAAAEDLKRLAAEAKKREIESLLSAKRMAMTPLWKSIPAAAARKPRIGRKC
jgi:peptide chain release factor 2